VLGTYPGDFVALLGMCLSYKSLATLAGCSEGWLRRQRDHGRLRVRRVDGKILIRLVDWIAFLEREDWNDLVEVS